MGGCVIMDDFLECLDIVDAIEEHGGYDTVRVFLASVMCDNQRAYENVLNGRIHGRSVKEIIK